MVKEWEREKIGNLLDFKNGLNKGKQFFGYGTPIVNYTDVYKKRGLKKEDIKGKVSLDDSEISRYAVKKGDVFFTRTSETPEEVGIASVMLEDIPDCAFSGFVLRGRPKTDRLIPEYCKYCFSTEEVRREIITRCTYTTRALTNGKQLSAIDIPVPEKKEQELIASALFDIDELIDCLDQLITKKKSVRQGAIQRLIENKVQLAGFSLKWDYLPFEDCFDLLPNNTLSRANLNYSDGIIRNIHYGDLLTKFHSVLQCDKENLPFINREKTSQLSPVTLRDGDFVMADTAEDETVGKISEVINVGNKQIVAGLHTIACRPKRKEMFAPMWIGYYMDSPAYHKQLLPFITGIKVSSIARKDLSQTVIAVPEKKEQEKIVEILFSMDNEINSLVIELDKYKRLRDGMLDQLLTGKIRLV